MLAKRIIPCLDVKDGQSGERRAVPQPRNHRRHRAAGAALCARRCGRAGVLRYHRLKRRPGGGQSWVSRVAEVIDIPFCVAGGIKSAEDASQILSFGADKISINSPALADPELISRLAERFGVQCIVVGIDTWFDSETGKYHVNQYTGDEPHPHHPVGNPRLGTGSAAPRRR